jgi:hypothetical protein
MSFPRICFLLLYLPDLRAIVGFFIRQSSHNHLWGHDEVLKLSAGTGLLYVSSSVQRLLL